MTETSGPEAGRVYDRSFLLSPDKRNQLMELWEVEQYGRECFSDPNYVSLYGMPRRSGMGAAFGCWRAQPSNACGTPSVIGLDARSKASCKPPRQNGSLLSIHSPDRATPFTGCCV